MQHKVRLLASSALLAATVLGATAVHAQSKPAATAAASNTIEELVITAEKRSQSLQDVPVAISAFTSEKRELLGINSIQDMTNFTPGLNYTSANDRAAVRGIGRLTNAHPVAVPVAVYDDGIYTTSTVTAGKSPIFSDRVEVLRGPQGTLYGRNSIGGAINIISKRPTEDPYGEVRATVANYGRTLIEAAVSGPLAEGLQYRLAGNWEKQRDGYYTNVVPGMPSEGNVIDQFYVEGQLQAKFGEHADGWAKAYITGWNNGSGGPGARAGYSPGPFGVGEYGAQNVAAGFACAPGGVVTNVVNTSPLGCVNPAASDPRKFATNVAQTVSLDNAFGIAVNYTYHLPGMDLKYVGGGINYHYTLFSDNGGGSISSFQIVVPPFNPAAPAAAQGCAATNLARPGACQNLTINPRQASTYQEDYHNISHEISLASSDNGALQWIGGLYYYKEGYRQPVFTTLFDQPQLDGVMTNAGAALGINPTGVGADFQRRLFDNRTQFEQESYAGYGQIDWKFADTLKATLGLRYSHDNLQGTESVRVICFGTTACLSGSSPNLLGTLTPPVDVTASGAVAYLGPSVPKGVVNNGKPGGVTVTSDGFATRGYDYTWTATTGTAGLQWDPDPDTMMYARYSRGYLMGGINSGVTSTLGQFPFTDAEHDNDYEVGLKKDFFNKTLQVNLALFWEDLTGFQAPLAVANNTGGLAVSQSQYVNIPKSVSRGIELETIWQPVDHLQVLFNYSYTDAYVKSLSGIFDPQDPEALAAGAKPLTQGLQTCTGTGSTPSATNPKPDPLCDVNTGLVQRAQDLSGNSLPQTPRNKVALSVTYTWELERGSLSPSVSYIWRDKQYGGIFERSYNAAPSWSQTDARVTWKGKQNKYSIIAYVKNVFDDLGYDGGASASRLSGVFNAATIAASNGGITPGVPLTTASAVTGAVNGIQKAGTVGNSGLNSSYNLTPPRTFGVEFQYRF
ncbi:TonB-dependent receptor [Phenylobacterium sp.]|uniref:TonB-dependent receptor n=1 Tax=Phenylobacterium sp. TaxID=1871053 RepID=UPI00356415C6